jgi:hypothetical protein
MSYTRKTAYGGMYSYDKAIAFIIKSASSYHAVALVTAGDVIAGSLSGEWTFNAGRVVNADIAGETNAGGKLEIQTLGAHGLSDGDLVVLNGMNNAAHNKPTYVDVTAADYFTCNDINYVAGAGASTGSVVMPSRLIAGSKSDGLYFATFTMVGTASSNNKNFKFELRSNLVGLDNVI